MTGVTTVLAGCLGGSSLSLGTWIPTEGAWPLARYDPANTGHNPNATPPRSEVQPVWSVETPIPVAGLLIADGLLTAYGEQGLVVIRTSDQQQVLEDFTPAYVAGIAPATDGGKRLYAAGPLGVAGESFVQLIQGWEYSGEDLSQSVLRTYETGDMRGPAALVANTEMVVIGHHAGNDKQLVAFDSDSADTRWQNEGIYPTLVDGSLVVSGTAGVSQYQPREGTDAYLNDGPKETWSASYSGATEPTVRSGRVIVGGNWNQQAGTSPLFGYDVETGEELWDPPKFSGAVNAPAVVNDTAYVSTNSGELQAVDLQDGTVRWTRETEWVQHSVVIGNNGVIVSCGGYPDGLQNGERGRVRAYDAESGDVLWTFSTSYPIASVALVSSTVYAGSNDGTVYALQK